VNEIDSELERVMSEITTLPLREDGFIRKKWSVRDCRLMVETGLLTAGKFELVEGEVVYKMGLGRLHIIVVARIIAVLTAIFGEAVQSQAQIGIGEIDEFNDPEPDVAVLKGTLSTTRIGSLTLQQKSYSLWKRHTLRCPEILR